MKEYIAPQNTAAEQALCGAMLMEREAIIDVVPMLKPSDFYWEVHGKIFEAMKSLYERSVPVDFITLSAELRRTCLDKELVGGTAYLTVLYESCSSSALAVEYAKLILDASIKRQIKSACEKIQAKIQGEEPGANQVEEAAALFFALGQAGNVAKGFVPAEPVVNDVFATLKARQEAGGVDVVGIPTGFNLDDLLGGCVRGEMTIIAARPSMGKSALGFQYALNMATGGLAFNTRRFEKVGVALVSLEMSKEKIFERGLSQVAEVRNSDMKRGYLSDYDFGKVNTARSIIARSGLLIRDTRNSTVFDVLSHLRKTAMEVPNLGVLVIDYLQLLEPEDDRAGRVEQLSQIGKGARAMAQEFNIHVIALAQLSRGVEQREDKRPMNSDLRGAGTLEEDADNIVFVYRPGYYARKGSPESNDTTTEIIVSKNRNDATGTVKMDFIRERVRFYDAVEGGSDG